MYQQTEVVTTISPDWMPSPAVSCLPVVSRGAKSKLESGRK